MNAQSDVAIEYIYILNQGINSPECSNKVVPGVPTTPRPGTSPAVTARPTTKPPATGAGGGANQNLWYWIIIIILLSSLLIMIILVGIYCLIDSRRGNRSQKGTQN